MRKVLLLLLVILTMSIFWIIAGRQISEFVDQFGTREIDSKPVHSVAYEGTGDGGSLVIDDHRLNLALINPHVGSTKNNQLAIASSEKVFAFGPLTSTEDEKLAAKSENGDSVSLALRRSYIFWPSFATGRPELKRTGYIDLVWSKKSGAKLKMVWSWPEIHAEARLIRIEITDASR